MKLENRRVVPYGLAMSVQSRLNALVKRLEQTDWAEGGRVRLKHKGVTTGEVKH